MNWKYITGFFDADGSVSAISMGKNRNKTLIVSFHNNEINILESIKDFIYKDLEIMGIIVKKPSKKDTHMDAYELRYCYKNALEIANKLTSIHPKKVHRIKIYNLIQSKTKRNGKYTEQELIERNNLILEFFKHK